MDILVAEFGGPLACLFLRFCSARCPPRWCPDCSHTSRGRTHDPPTHICALLDIVPPSANVGHVHTARTTDATTQHVRHTRPRMLRTPFAAGRVLPCGDHPPPARHVTPAPTRPLAPAQSRAPIAGRPPRMHRARRRRAAGPRLPSHALADPAARYCDVGR